MSKQQLLNLSLDPVYLIEDFLVSECNKDPYNYIIKWPAWPSNYLLLYGPKSAGKTHLCHIWSFISNAKIISNLDHYCNFDFSNLNLIIENIENITVHETLLHVYNIAKEQNNYIVFTSRLAPFELNFKLKDLHTRIRAMNSIKINLPDNELITGVLVKLASDRQLNIKNEVISFLVNKIEGSFDKLYRIVDILDYEAMSNKQKITIPFVKKILDNSTS